MVLQVSTRFPLRLLAVVALGGIIGALGRVAIAEFLGTYVAVTLVAGILAVPVGTWLFRSVRSI